MRRLLYLHGFASGPDSRKGRAFAEYFSARGYRVERLDLRVPDRDRLRVSAMLEVVDAALSEPALLVGSSLGGLVAAHVAAKRDDVPMCVLMAPAFGFAERWHQSLGEDRVARWRDGEPLIVDDHAGGPPLEVDFGFYEDAALVDALAPELCIPTLVFHGRGDEVVDITSSRRLARRVSNVTLVELDDGHALTHSLPLMLPTSLRFFERTLTPRGD